MKTSTLVSPTPTPLPTIHTEATTVTNTVSPAIRFAHKNTDEVYERVDLEIAHAILPSELSDDAVV